MRPPDEMERRWERLWHALLLGTIGLGTFVHVASAPPAEQAIRAIATAGVLAAWHVVLAVHHREHNGETRHGLVWLAGTIALLVALLEIDDAYGLVLYGLFPQ